MNPITIPNITIPVIGLPTIGIPSVGFPSASGGGLAWPAGMKEHIKAIYDPAKQGMTNYDVIEAYVEDFTNWTLDNTGITSTPKKIVIPAGTELKYVIAFRGFNGFTAGFDIKYTGNAVITYRYNKEDGTVGIITIDKSGIYHLPASVITQKNFGFYCNPQTVTEEATIEQLPTSILKDLSDNGNHAYLYGGKGKLNSGMGVYQEDFTAWKTYNRADVDITPNILHITKVGTSNAVFISNTFLNNRNIYKLDIKGITNQSLYIGNYASANSLIKITQDGLYEIDSTKFPDSDIYGIGFIDFIGDCDITITQIPDYPNLLCYDGKMYAVCYGFPILEDYTVMADRTWFDTSTNNKTFISKRNTDNSVAAFLFEKVNGGTQQTTASFGESNSVEFAQGISYQSKNSYNGIAIKSGNTTDIDTLVIGGSILNNNFSELWQGCHGKIIIADRSFTEGEITWLKDNWKKI